jgi:two-component system, LytTR family, response regulator
MIKALVVDDEPRARLLLKSIIADYCKDVEVVGECEDVPNAVKGIKKYKPDLVLLDIEMPGYTGLELFDFFNEDEIDFEVIFITAYNDYAIKAFKFSAIDYLLKPVHHTELVDAIDRFKQKQNKGQYKVLSQNYFETSGWDQKRIVINTSKSAYYLKPNEIIMMKAMTAYSEIYTVEGQKILASRNLKYFEEVLEDMPQFFRCHKSFIINLSMVKEYVKSDGGTIKLTNNLEADLATDKTAIFVDMMKNGTD